MTTSQSVKPVLLLALCTVSLQAHANLSCSELAQGTAHLSLIDDHPAHVTVQVSKATGALTLTGHEDTAGAGVFSETKYLLVTPMGENATLTVTHVPLLTRGGGFCGRAGCSQPTHPAPRDSYSAALVISSNPEVDLDFTCYETAP